MTERNAVRFGLPSRTLGDADTFADHTWNRQTDLARAMRAAASAGEGLWQPPSAPELRPSSSAWHSAERRHALLELRVAYAGGIVVIPAGSRYYVDAFERVLVGWHGSFDPPRGMEGGPLFRTSDDVDRR